MTFKDLYENLGYTGSRGSKVRCHILTSGTEGTVAANLTSLLPEGCGTVPPTGSWMPDGLRNTDEAQLHRHSAFLGESATTILRSWWLASEKEARTPNWDIAATLHTDDSPDPGVLLVEAKAHTGELSKGGKTKPSSTPGSQANDTRIRQALSEANDSLNAVLPGFNLSADEHYQVSNRFAWAWKIAALGYPVVLIYLGFLDARDMTQETLLTDQGHWEKTVKDHCRGVVPDAAWGRRIPIGEAWIFPAITALRVEVPE